jgi:hypothetical protein
MSEQKTIVINPELFSFSGGKTRKKRPNPNPKPIKIRDEKPKPAENNKTTKLKVLKYIRKQQEQNYKQLMKGETAPAPSSNNSFVNEFKSDFDQSIEFLDKIAKQKEAHISLNPKNRTLKQPPGSGEMNSVLYSNSVLNPMLELNENVELTPPSNVFDIVTERSFPTPTLDTPKYGCLKNGKLPTYKMWKTQTQKIPSYSSTSYNSAAMPIVEEPNPILALEKQQQLDTQRQRAITQEQNRQEIRRFFEKRKEAKLNAERAKRGIAEVQQSVSEKQKRILRRTFHIGKSKYYPRVGVLISNKTIRREIETKHHNIKQTPIEHVRKYLAKKGLIRIGSSCPNDVLRKMYESVNLMCGDVQNHNPDNLLYNYLNNGI